MKPTIASMLSIIAVGAGGLPVTNAAVLTVTGSISGSINHGAVAATCSGNIDTSGVAGASFTVPFTEIPSSWSPLCIRVSCCTIIMPGGLRPLGGARNLFDLTGGNFSATCIYSYPTLTGSSITTTATVATNGNYLTYNMNLSGSYTGPVDLVDISNAQFNWTQGPGDQILETGSANVVQAGGGMLPITWTVTYSNGGLLLPSDQAAAVTYNPLNYNPQTQVLGLGYTGQIWSVPEPGVLSVLALGGLLMARRRRA